MHEVTLASREYEDLLETSIRARLLEQYIRKADYVLRETVIEIMDFDIPAGKKGETT